MGILDIMTKMVGEVFQESMADQIRLESMEDDETLTMKDGSMMSMIHLHGALRTPGFEELERIVESLRIALTPYLSQPGHALEVTFTRDAASARRSLERMVDRTRRAAKSLRMDLDDVLNERVKVLSGKMVSESCMIAIYTRTTTLNADETKDEVAGMKARLEGMPSLQTAQVPGKAMKAVHTRHSALVDALTASLRAVGQMAQVLNVKEILQEIRGSLYPETYPMKEEWSPRLPAWSEIEDGHPAGRPIKMMMAPETPAETAMIDFSNLGVPTFDRQLATEDAFIENSRVVRLGNMKFSAFDMTLIPEILPDFNSLVADITAKSHLIPWRASIRIESGGVQAQRMKALYLAIFTWAAPTHNRRIKDAISTNVDIDGRDDTVIRFRMSFSTWAPVGREEQLRRNAQTVIGAVKRWGNSGADGVSGDPMATLLSTMPGVTMGSTAPVASGPLRDGLAMLPLSRQASPWETGPVLLRTASGKPWPFQPGSSKQTTWITLFVGTPGSGKSVMMNTLNFASAITPSTAGGSEPVLPRISILDIGPSSAGLISLVQESLPAELRHLVVFQKLKMNRDNTVNVFDTHLGMRKPTAADRQFLGNFINLICGDGNQPPSAPMRGLIGASIDRAFEDKMDDKSPNRYLPDDEPRVDRVLHDLGFETGEGTIWWEVVDFLMANGHLMEAEIAQRHAVPQLSDLVTAALSDQVQSLYGKAMDSETGQPMTESFMRMISEVVRDYAILSGHTRYGIGSARIVAMDLMEVTGRGAGATALKQTAMMYMLARQVTTRDFFLDEVEFRNAVRDGVMPRIYLDHHVDRARQNLQVPKIICMDEFHRTGNNPSVTDQVMQDGREGRKFNVDLRIASQLIEDFPKPIIEIASGLIVCNAGSENSINVMDEMFTLSDSERAVIRNNLRGPGPNGAPFWAMFRMKGEGQVRQELNLTLGPAEIWAFSTTAEDVTLRSRLYEILGPKLARQVLASRYPGGSAKSDIEIRIRKMEELGERVNDDNRGDIFGKLIDELRLQAYIMLGKSV